MRGARHMLTINGQGETQDANGDVVVGWAPVFEDVPAAFLPGPGREYLAGEALRNEATGRFVIRWLPGVEETQQVVSSDGSTWEIVAVIPDPTMRKELTLMVRRDS